MTVYVVNRPKPGQKRGDWAVKNGRQIVSHHRKKKNAVKKARRLAKDKETVLKIQKTNGKWQDVRNYS